MSDHQLFVRGIDFRVVDLEEAHGYFAAAGVRLFEVKPGSTPRSCIIRCATASDLQLALALNGQSFHTVAHETFKISVQPYRPEIAARRIERHDAGAAASSVAPLVPLVAPRDGTSYPNVYVSQLEYHTRTEELSAHFCSVGPVVNVELMPLNADSKRGRCAIITFQSVQHASDAVERLHNSMFTGGRGQPRPIRVESFRPKSFGAAAGGAAAKPSSAAAGGAAAAPSRAAAAPSRASPSATQLDVSDVDTASHDTLDHNLRADFHRILRTLAGPIKITDVVQKLRGVNAAYREHIKLRGGAKKLLSSLLPDGFRVALPPNQRPGNEVIEATYASAGGARAGVGTAAAITTPPASSPASPASKAAASPRSAEQQPVRAHCKFFAKGYCKDGGDCRFQHADARSAPLTSSAPLTTSRSPTARAAESTAGLVGQTRRVCAALEIDADLPVPAAVRAANRLMGVTPAAGATMPEQVRVLLQHLGI